MVCPRCSTNVSAEALYCSYCNLPKPKAGFAAEGTTTPPNRPAAQKAANKRSKPSGGPVDRQRSAKRKVHWAVVAGAALLAVISVGVYIFVAPLVHSNGVEPKLALSALDKLKHMPSNDPDVTIDARLTGEIEKSKRVGNLVGYQGWTLHPIRGTKTRVLLVFSYREVGNTEQRAEWLADLNANTFAPQTELAKTISKR